jgi:hypothetical protein
MLEQPMIDTAPFEKLLGPLKGKGVTVKMQPDRYTSAETAVEMIAKEYGVTLVMEEYVTFYQ